MSQILYLGYNPKFLQDDNIKFNVPLPLLNTDQKKDLAFTEEKETIIKYLNYSLQLSVLHKFPYYTASNINGALFKNVVRKDNWKKDNRIIDFQWGNELYKAVKSHFDRGHMTKREDVQWGYNPIIAQQAADSTFFYTNSVPQHRKLNRSIWKRLEYYILHSETVRKSLKICVFTGPILSINNPFFVTPVLGQNVRIPTLFWKVIVYPKSNGLLYRVGFIMSQESLLLKDEIIENLESSMFNEDQFMKFANAATYQVNISLIEDLSGLTMPPAIDSYNDSREKELILRKVKVEPNLESYSLDSNYFIDNIIL